MNDEIRMGSGAQGGKFDLEDRTAGFGEKIVRFAKKISRSPVNDPLAAQLVCSATSIGANYCEANDSVSRKDFRNKIGICRKESRETLHWLRMVAAANEDFKAEARGLWQEAKELNLIFWKDLREQWSDEMMTERHAVPRLGRARIACHFGFGFDSSFELRHSDLLR